MKVLIIGGVAAGTKAAAKLKRLNRTLQVTLLTKDQDISYAGCGLPYYVGGLIEERKELIVNTPQKYHSLTGVEVLTGKEAIALNSTEKCIIAKDVSSGTKEVYGYDELIIATGASPVVPPVDGIAKNGVFTMRTPDDAVAIRDYCDKNDAKKAVIIGGGFIGLEIAENLHNKGLKVTVVDVAYQILPNVLDPEMANYVKRHLIKKGINVLTGTKVEALLGKGNVSSVKTSAGLLQADVVVASVGIRPNTAFLNDSGLEMTKGCIVVNSKLQTNLPNVYAIGDCAMVTNRITGKPQWSPMGSSANLEGRTLAQILTGSTKEYKGVLGTGIVKLPDLNCARTGLGEQQAIDAGYDVITTVAVTDDKPHYYPNSNYFITKLIVEKETHKILGAQVVGAGTVDKMIDIVVMAINMNATLEDLENADFAYAPPFSTAIHPLVQTAYILMNKINGDFVSMTPAEYASGKADTYRIIDTSAKPSIHGATYVDFTKVNGVIDGIGLDEKLLLVCNRGKRAYFLQNRMRHFGYTNTIVLEGSTVFNDVRVKNSGAKVSAADITRVKALGFLFDKRTADKFNCRVITRNGKITAQESKAIADAAELFGSGEIAMTSRLTIEIQGVPYENIDAIREYLAQFGLETGGTGSKVRPVVSCKGTTCQYGLIDTFALSEKIHKRFYHGYANVKLPHKFKIAVAGCPNNCIKPDLNDVGIAGRKVPHIDLEKCRGCKVCQVEKNCPIHVAKLENGKLVIDDSACNHCGRCVGKCPFKAIETYTTGYRVFIGGRWGKKVSQGIPLDKIFTDEAEVLDIVEKTILLFREQGITGERFADTIERIGFENVQEQLLDNGLLERKADNLAQQKHVKGGATC